jgi:excisionase family DNA binding protein
MTAFLTMEEVAALLKISRRTLQKLLRGRPCGRLAGRQRRFTEAEILRWYMELPCPSDLSRRKVRAKATTSGGRISGSTLTEALRLASERLPPKSSRPLNATSNVAPFPNRETPRLPRLPQPT